uniref:14.2 kDa salivary protein n=3 Tax=Nyssomyia TaxID=252611 RepID=J7HF03_9DIPT
MNNLTFLLFALLAITFVKKSQGNFNFLPKDRDDCFVSLMTPAPGNKDCLEDIDGKDVQNGKKTFIKCTDSKGNEYTFYDCFDINLFVSHRSPDPEPITYTKEAQVSFALVQKHIASKYT